MIASTKSGAKNTYIVNQCVMLWPCPKIPNNETWLFENKTALTQVKKRFFPSAKWRCCVNQIFPSPACGRGEDLIYATAHLQKGEIHFNQLMSTTLPIRQGSCCLYVCHPRESGGIPGVIEKILYKPEFWVMKANKNVQKNIYHINQIVIIL